jgi:hypothetical protein
LFLTPAAVIPSPPSIYQRELNPRAIAAITSAAIPLRLLKVLDSIFAARLSPEVCNFFQIDTKDWKRDTLLAAESIALSPRTQFNPIPALPVHRFGGFR